MAPQDVKYFLILRHTIAKRDGIDFLYSPGIGWVPDVDRQLADRLMGYDKFEPDDSPYKMFNECIMQEVESIPEAEAIERIHNLNIENS